MMLGFVAEQGPVLSRGLCARVAGLAAIHDAGKSQSTDPCFPRRSPQQPPLDDDFFELEGWRAPYLASEQTRPTDPLQDDTS